MSYIVSNLTELKAIGETPYRVAGYPVFVKTPAENEAGAWYVGASSSAIELGTIIVTPNDNPASFRWVKTSNLIHSTTTLPSGAPPIKGITWIASLTGPNRTVRFLSTGTGSSSDWIPRYNEVLSGSTSPTFTPDYTGQLVDDINTNNLSIAEDTVSNANWSSRTSPGASEPGLVGSWAMNASPWVDSIGGRNLIERNGTVSIVSDGADTVTELASSSNICLRTTGNAVYQTGDVDWVFNIEVKIIDGINGSIAQIGEATNETNTQWYLILLSGEFYFEINPASGDALTLFTGISIEYDVWYDIELSYTAATNLGSITVNGGTPVTGVMTGIPRTGTTPAVYIGSGVQGNPTFRVRGDVKFYKP